MKKTTNLGLNKYSYGESVVADHPDPAKRQAPDDTLNHNFDVLDTEIQSLRDRLAALEAQLTLGAQ